MTSLSPRDSVHLRRCVELAEQALDAGDDPFGSVLVGADGMVLAEALNREATDDDPTAHPELELVHWAIANLTSDERAASTVYTSGEHCPMCAAAHGWAGLGAIVAAVSSRRLAEWRASWGLPAGPVAVVPVTAIVPGIRVVSGVAPLESEMRALHLRAQQRRA